MLSQQTPYTETNILSIITPFSDIGKSFITSIYTNWHTIADDTMLHLNLCLPTQDPAAFTTILSTSHKHMAYHNTIPNIPTHLHLHGPKHRQTHPH